MPLARDGKRADAESRETEFSGLPKACKLTIPANAQTTNLNAQTLIVYNTFAFNYGGYTPKISVVYGAPFIEGIIIPEPGVYECVACAAQNAGPGQTVQMWIAVNGVVALPDGTQAASQQSNAVIAGAPPALQVTAPLELKQGDVVGSIWVSLNANPNIVAAYPWLYVEKKGGQY